MAIAAPRVALRLDGEHAAWLRAGEQPAPRVWRRAQLEAGAPPAPLLDHALPAAASSSSLDLVGFSAMAGSADGPAPLLATLVCAVLGAIAFETLATNKVPPIPDPLLGGVWGSLHALVRGPSKATGLAATSAFAAVKTLVAEQLEKS